MPTLLDSVRPTPTRCSGTLSKVLQNTYLRDYTAPKVNGQFPFSYKNATPAALHPTVLKLMELSARAKHEMLEVARKATGLQERPRDDEVHGVAHTTLQLWDDILATEPGPNNPTVQAFDARLEGYRKAIDDAVIAGKHADAEATHYTVTLPLLVGWYPNADGTDIDPAQKQRRAADSGYAARMLCMAGVRGDFEASQQLSEFFRAEAEGLKVRAVETGEAAYEYMADAMAAGVGMLLAPTRKLQTTAKWVIGGVAAAAVVYYLSKRKR